MDLRAYAEGYVIGGLFASGMVAHLNKTFTETALAIVIGGFVVLIFSELTR